MSSTIDLEPILALPPADRLRIAQQILNSISEENTPVTLTDDEKAELVRRVDAFRANPSSGVPWEEVEAAALARVSK